MNLHRKMKTDKLTELTSSSSSKNMKAMHVPETIPAPTRLPQGTGCVSLIDAGHGHINTTLTLETPQFISSKSMADRKTGLLFRRGPAVPELDLELRLGPK